MTGEADANGKASGQHTQPVEWTSHFGEEGRARQLASLRVLLSAFTGAWLTFIATVGTRRCRLLLMTSSLLCHQLKSLCEMHAGLIGALVETFHSSNKVV